MNLYFSHYVSPFFLPFRFPFERGRTQLVQPFPVPLNSDNQYAKMPPDKQKLGDARVILATAPSAQAISPLVDGLSPNGLLLVPAAPAEPLTINVFSLIMRRSSVAGWYSGTARDSQDTLEFSALSDVHPMIEKYPLDRVAEAYEQMHSGKVRFRVVLVFST